MPPSTIPSNTSRALARLSPKNLKSSASSPSATCFLCFTRAKTSTTQPYAVVSAPYDMECCVRATVLQKRPARRVTGGRVMNRVLAADDSGILSLTWFNAPYAADNLEVGETYYFEGRIGGALTRREFLHPLVRHRGPGRGLPLRGGLPAPTVCPPPATPAAPTQRWRCGRADRPAAARAADPTGCPPRRRPCGIHAPKQ